MKWMTYCAIKMSSLNSQSLTVTPYGARELGQHWIRQWLVAWRHQAITWTKVDRSSVKSSGIHFRANSQEMPLPSITKIWLKITCLKFNSNFPGADELTHCDLNTMVCIAQTTLNRETTHPNYSSWEDILIFRFHLSYFQWIQLSITHH